MSVSVLAYFLVARACGYDNGAVLSYAAYLAAYVALPGIVCLSAVFHRPITVTTAIALGLPTGFALEIFGFLALSALGARGAYPFLPLAWAAAGAVLVARRREWPLRVRISLAHAGIALAASLLLLLGVVTATGQMFAQAPLAGGLPAVPLFHDWVYLVSRAAAIKAHWPLEDPSLSGTALQYHYFLLVHVAAAAAVTRLEVSLVFLRLVVLPLGVVLAVQAYVLGRKLSRSPWGGILAAFLTMVAGEVSFAPNWRYPAFLGLFGRWLYESPTFFFGMIFFGALLLGVLEWSEERRRPGRVLAWLTLLGAAATGAKGTVMPVVLTALGLWIAARGLRRRQIPWRLLAAAVGLLAAFLAVYFRTMAGWGTGDASLAPFAVMSASAYWLAHIAAWQQALAGWLGPRWAAPVAGAGCAVLVAAGTEGVRILALPYLFMRKGSRQKAMTTWLTLAAATSCALGLLLQLNGDGQLYLLLMMRLPLAVLTAAFVVRAARCSRRLLGADPLARTLRPAFAAGVLAAGLVLAAVQNDLWRPHNRAGFASWLHSSPTPAVDEAMGQLNEAMLWIRTNTTPDSVLISNAFTPDNLRRDNGSALDHTPAGLHYYYSAISERSLWVEGPGYALNRPEAWRRMKLAADIFYRGRSPASAAAGPAPLYLLVDQCLSDGAKVALPPEQCVFANARLAVYRVPPATLAMR